MAEWRSNPHGSPATRFHDHRPVSALARISGRDSSERVIQESVQWTNAALAAALTTRPPSTPRRPAKRTRHRKGWGPYQSVLKERSVDFNLTLDVQNLRQEIQQLTTTRELLQSRVLQCRHSPTGSLMQTVREFFRVFRQGFRVEEQPRRRRRRVITQGVQIDFLTSVLDEELNSALGRMGGVGFMVEQLRRYSLLLRWIHLEMGSFEIVRLGESDVMVQATCTLRLQVLRDTVRVIFPHILGNEWLCARLIGAEIVVPSVITFDFNAADRICHYEPSMDYVTGFAQILQDPNDVLELMGAARLGEKHTIGGTEDGGLERIVEGVIEDEEVARLDETGLVTRDDSSKQECRPTKSRRLVDLAEKQRQNPLHHVHSGSSDASAAACPSRRLPAQYIGVAGQYLSVFATGWPPDVDIGSTTRRQRQFLHEFVSPYVTLGVGQRAGVGHQAIEHMWRSLCSAFELVTFRSLALPQVYDDGKGVSVYIRVVYDLAIEIVTLQVVFPHILRHPELVQALLGMEISCPSDLWLEWEDASSDLVTRVSERLHWDVALLPLLPRAEDRAFVLRGAALSREGYVLRST